MGIFERFLSVWVGLAILLGVGLGIWFTPYFQWIAHNAGGSNQFADCGADLADDLSDDDTN